MERPEYRHTRDACPDSRALVPCLEERAGIPPNESEVLRAIDVARS